MKKRLNIITFIFIGVIICVSVVNIYLKSDYIFNIEEAVDSAADYSSRKSGNSYSLRLGANQFSVQDSLYNEKTGVWMPSNIKEVVVYAPESEGAKFHVADIFVKSIFIIMALTAIIMLIYNFIKIMISVNKSEIFVWINVRRLRRIGLSFILIFISKALMSIYEGIVTAEMIKLSDYSILMESLSVNALVDGMIAFVVAEIFAVGLRIKEEQELTI